MVDDVKLEVVKKTQDMLGKYIKKPPLTEKLLKKPPFRFLHDIITNVIRETGFLNGVFTPDELNHENIKDRDSKVAFLQKAIDAVKIITGIQLMVRPSKIVAGHEAGRTNEFLQAIGKALDKKLSSNDYIAKLNKKDRLKDKGGKAKTTGKEESTKSKSKPGAQSKSHSRDKSKSKEPVKKKSSSSISVANDKQTKPTEDSAVEDTPKPLDGSRTVPPEAASSAAVEPEVEVREEQPAEAPAQEVQQGGAAAREAAPVEPEPPPLAEPLPAAPHEGKGKEAPEGGKDLPDSAPVRTPEVPKAAALDGTSPRKSASHHEKKKKSAKVRTRTEESEGENLRNEADTPVEIGVFGSKTAGSEAVVDVPAAPRMPSARPRTARPASARPAAPRIRDRGEVAVQEQPKSVIGKVNVITDVDSMKEQDEFENFMVVEAPSAMSLDQQELPLPSPLPAPGEEGQHGHLVAQILETQKELEDEKRFPGRGQDPLVKRVEIEWEAGQRREKEIASKEVDRLRMSIQTLTRAANPLGKLMDFLQEDVDAMQRELDSWRATNSELKLQLIQEQSLTEESVEPMKAHLQQLQQSILQKLDEISSLKATILRNDAKIQRLVTGGSLPQTDKIT